MIRKESKNDTRKRRHTRVREKLSGTKECPRLNVFRSNSQIFVNIILQLNSDYIIIIIL